MGNFAENLNLGNRFRPPLGIQKMATAMDVDPPASSSTGSTKGDKKRFEVKKVIANFVK